MAAILFFCFEETSDFLGHFWYNEKQELYTLFGQRRSICKEGRICGRKACSLS